MGCLGKFLMRFGILLIIIKSLSDISDRWCFLEDIDRKLGVWVGFINVMLIVFFGYRER